MNENHEVQLNGGHELEIGRESQQVVRPAVLVDVGVQDGVAALTYNFTNLLDKLSFPYIFIQDPGNHHTENSDSHFPDYLKWLMPAQ